MCEFCHKHGEGKKWYLEAKNYSDDLMNDLKRRKFGRDFVSDPPRLARNVGRLDDLDRAPGVVKRLVSWVMTRVMKKYHFGQIVPIEDVERILQMTNKVVRLSCICRYAQGKGEGRYCYGISMSPDGGLWFDFFKEVDPAYIHGPSAKGLEDLTREDALAQMREYEREGLCHTIWTIVSPFIVGICNCDRTDCLAMQATVTHDVQVMFRAEYVAEADPDQCSGCRSCMRVCQFGAIAYSAMDRKVEIDPRKCYGCGICRSVCNKDAIDLRDRVAVPEAAKLW